MKISVRLLVILTLLYSSAESATVKKIKGTKALISVEGSDLKINDQFFTVSSTGKKRGLLQITSIKGDQAVANVIKGIPEVGQTLLAVSMGPQKTSKATGQKKSSKASSSTSSFKHMGLLGSYLMNKMAVNFTAGGNNFSTAMVGTGFGLLGYYDYDYTNAFQLRGAGGIEQFQAAESCAALAACNVSISYLSGYGIAKYNFVNGSTKVWAGGGLGLLYAISKASTVLDTALITSTYTITLSAGADFDMGGGSYLPVVIDYSMFPSSASVTASYIALRVGWGWR